MLRFHLTILSGIRFEGFYCAGMRSNVPANVNLEVDQTDRGVVIHKTNGIGATCRLLDKVKLDSVTTYSSVFIVHLRLGKYSLLERTRFLSKVTNKSVSRNKPEPDGRGRK